MCVGSRDALWPGRGSWSIELACGWLSPYMVHREPAETLQWNCHHPGPSVLPVILLCWEGGDSFLEGGLPGVLSQACSSALPPAALLQLTLAPGPRGLHSQHCSPPGDPYWPLGWDRHGAGGRDGSWADKNSPSGMGSGAPSDPNVSGVCSKLGTVRWEAHFQWGNREGFPDLEGLAGVDCTRECSTAQPSAAPVPS